MSGRDRAAPSARGFDIGFGVVAALFAAVALWVWFPVDIRGGFIERGVSGDPAPGDAFFPTLLAWGILALGALQCANALLRSPPESAGALRLGDLGFLAGFATLFAAAIALMATTGPVLAELFSDRSYRQLSATPPWSYSGFLLGGLLLGYAPIAVIERRIRWRGLLIVAAALAVLVVIFDLLLSGVRLPPNADV
jgi:hypothetical protein